MDNLYRAFISMYSIFLHPPKMSIYSIIMVDIGIVSVMYRINNSNKKFILKILICENKK
jgi:hypothetical protein